MNSPALNTKFWVSSNFSSGYIDIDSEHQRTHRFDSQYSTLTFGAESQLFSHNNPKLKETSELNLSSQGWLARQSIVGDGLFTSDLTTEGQDIQISLSGSHEIELTKNRTFSPSILIGVRQAKKDVDSVTGLEFGFGTLLTSNNGLSLEGSARGFKGHEYEDFATNLSSEIIYNTSHDNTGSQLSISPSWGQSTGNTQVSLWHSNLNRENELFDHYTNGLQISSEFSYGIGLLDGIGILMPFSAFNYSESDLMSFDIGNRIKIGTDSSFAIKGTREVRNNNITNNKVQLQGAVRW